MADLAPEWLESLRVKHPTPLGEVELARRVIGGQTAHPAQVTRRTGGEVSACSG